MEQYVSAHPPALRNSVQPGAGSEASVFSDSAPRSEPLNYLAARWRTQRCEDAQDSVPWERAAYVSSRIATLQKNLVVRSSFPRTDSTPTLSSTTQLEMHLRNLEAVLDKLLSSFSGAVLDPADHVHSASVCVSSSRVTVEHLPHLLALQPHFETVNRSMRRFEASSRDAVSASGGSVFSPVETLSASKRLTELEGQLSVIDISMADLRNASEQSCALFDTVSGIYTLTAQTVKCVAMNS